MIYYKKKDSMKLIDLFNQVPHYLELLHEDFADSLEVRDFPKFEPHYSKVVGTFEGKDIWASRYYPNHHVFGIIENNNLQAFITIEDNLINGCHPLTRIWSKGGKTTVGYITALVMFVLRKVQLKLIIKDIEPLTQYGCNWLVKLVQRNRLTATNAITHNKLTSDEIVNDFNQSKTNRECTTLAIILEGEKFDYPLFSLGYRTLSEKIQITGKNSDLL